VADTVADLAGALDLLLTDAALGPLRRLLPRVSWVRFAAWRPGPAPWPGAAPIWPGSWPGSAGERSGPQRPAPADLGGGGLRAQEAAPGTYVLDH